MAERRLPLPEDTIRVLCADWAEEFIALQGAGHRLAFEVKAFRNGDRLYFVQVLNLEESEAERRKPDAGSN